jgi:ATP-dependent helicase/nuclease subunit A
MTALVEGRMVTGTIDRLVIEPRDAMPPRVRLIDFKTARRPPGSVEAIPAAYLRQMAAYAQALAAIHPGAEIEAALLYTQTPAIFALPAALLDRYKLGSTA